MFGSPPSEYDDDKRDRRGGETSQDRIDRRITRLPPSSCTTNNVDQTGGDRRTAQPARSARRTYNPPMIGTNRLTMMTE